MVLREGRYGKFYGCSRFPHRRGTRVYTAQSGPSTTATQQTTARTSPPPQTSAKNRNVGWVWLWAILAFFSFVSNGVILGIIFIALAFYAYARGKIRPQATYIPPNNNPNPNNAQTKQVPRNPTPPQPTAIDPEELKRIYYQLAHKYHPDIARTPEEHKTNEEMMRRINHAYQEKNLGALKALL